MPHGYRLFITRENAAALLICLVFGRMVGAMTVLSLTAEKMYVPVGGGMIQSAASHLDLKVVFCLAVAFSGVVILFASTTSPNRVCGASPWCWHRGSSL